MCVGFYDFLQRYVSIFSCVCITSVSLFLSPRFSVLFSELPGLSPMSYNVVCSNVVRHFPSQMALILSLSLSLYHYNLVINTLIVVGAL